jgi:hypothetical protein
MDIDDLIIDVRSKCKVFFQGSTPHGCKQTPPSEKKIKIENQAKKVWT